MKAKTETLESITICPHCGLPITKWKSKKKCVRRIIIDDLDNEYSDELIKLVQFLEDNHWIFRIAHDTN